jgi:hypothetical protein
VTVSVEADERETTKDAFFVPESPSVTDGSLTESEGGSAATAALASASTTAAGASAVRILR